MAWLYAASNVMSRKLKNVNFAVIGFYHPVAGLILSAILMFTRYCFTGVAPTIFPATSYWYQLAACMADFVLLNSQNIAFQSDSSGFIAVLGYVVIFYGFLADKFIFNTPVTPFDLVGASVIFIVTIIVTIKKLSQKHAIVARVQSKEDKL